MSLHFTTIFTQEGKWYVARCAELGVVSQGKSIDEAQKNLKEAVELYLEDQPKSNTRRFATQRTLISTLDIEYA